MPTAPCFPNLKYGIAHVHNLAWLTLEGATIYLFAVKRGFQPPNHNKQTWKNCFPTTTMFSPKVFPCFPQRAMLSPTTMISSARVFPKKPEIATSRSPLRLLLAPGAARAASSRRRLRFSCGWQLKIRGNVTSPRDSHLSWAKKARGNVQDKLRIGSLPEWIGFA